MPATRFSSSLTQYSDAFWLYTLITAVGDAFIPLLHQKNLTLHVSQKWIGPRPSAVAAAIGTAEPSTVKQALLVEEFDDAPVVGQKNTLGGSMALGSSDDVALLKDAMRELERYRSLDLILPSFQNTVTTACLRVECKFMLYSVKKVGVF